MNIIKLILALLGVIFGVFIVMWVIGLLSSIFWYAFWIAIIGGIGYGGYRLFRRAEDKLLDGGSSAGSINARDYDMSWDEYERKYLKK